MELKKAGVKGLRKVEKVEKAERREERDINMELSKPASQSKTIKTNNAGIAKNAAFLILVTLVNILDLDIPKEEVTLAIAVVATITNAVVMKLSSYFRKEATHKIEG